MRMSLDDKRGVASTAIASSMAVKVLYSGEYLQRKLIANIERLLQVSLLLYYTGGIMMKRLTATLLSSTALLGCLSVSAFAFDLNLPSAAKAPVIDGVINADEWAGALTRNIGMDSVDKGEGGVFVTGNPDKEKHATGTVKLMWDKNNFYVSGAYVDEPVFFLVDPSGDGAMASSATNVQDGFQIVLDPNGDAETYNDLSIIDFTMTPDGTGPMYWQHWGSPRREFPNIAMAAKKTATGFVFEAAIPWSDFDEDYMPAKGDLLGNINLIDDVDESTGQQVYGDGLTAPWVAPSEINKLTLK